MATKEACFPRTWLAKLNPSDDPPWSKKSQRLQADLPDRVNVRGATYCRVYGQLIASFSTPVCTGVSSFHPATNSL